MKKESKRLIVIGILICILGVIGITYALWNKVFVQSGENLVNSDCFELTFEEKDGIQLENSFPMYDNDGKKLKPYIFKISNKCNNEVDYQLNLETTNNTTLKDNYIKVMLNDSEPFLYSNKEEVEVTITNGKGARVLESGILKENEVKEYELRVWMDEKVTQNDEGAMNGVFESKITITATYRKPTLASIIKNQPIVTSGNGLYEVHHEYAEITYTSDVNAQNLLKETELRYAGSNPNNYVKFNNELWRIIGLVNTPEGQRVKIIRDESIGAYSWDSSEPNINAGLGVNEWSQADLMLFLNNGKYYNSDLTIETKEMIDTITWNLGSWSYPALSANVNLMFSLSTSKEFYNLERSNYTGKQCSESVYCNDSILRTLTWKGKVGLMHPSDYGYATSGGSTMNKQTCESTSLLTWGDVADCYINNWLYKENEYRWTITPNSFDTVAAVAFKIESNGSMSAQNATNTNAVLPSLYLKPNVNFISGNGTQGNPYLLSMDA